MGLAEGIREAAAAALAGSGVVIEDVAVHPAGKRRLVRVGVARDVSDLLADDLTSTVEPLTLDEVADASRAVGAALDEADTMGAAPYTLEVSSLGVDHPLSTPAQFRRNVGRLLELTVSESPAGQDPSTDPQQPPADGANEAGPSGDEQTGPAGGPGARVVVARLVEAGPDGIRVADAPHDLLPYDRISAATVQVEFTRPGGKDD
ncbi:ribosome maturation factor RimP [Ornithinimicrobium cavernae]|uniref:ribosome maturation factor RimP n=1 Tax=Ornithinimicrobium cavernae TaxID=2666047 RepID=UPI000D696688|nr:ribosome assembly cofactor RimP [Ornithinimicrobium cavernae]